MHPQSIGIQGYTEIMKTAVSIPNDIYEGAERLARKTKKSRSQLYSEAVREYVARHAPEELTQAMNRACIELGQPTDDFVREAASRILTKSEW